MTDFPFNPFDCETTPIVGGGECSCGGLKLGPATGSPYIISYSQCPTCGEILESIAIGPVES